MEDPCSVPASIPKSGSAVLGDGVMVALPRSPQVSTYLLPNFQTGLLELLLYSSDQQPTAGTPS